jgi:hypothetical protein
MNDQKKETTVSNEAALSDTDLDKVAGGDGCSVVTPKPVRVEPRLPHPLPGNATLHDWLE